MVVFTPPHARAELSGEAIALALILTGQKHPPVVYFARMTGGVKIGWTTNLARRMSALYVRMDDVLAVVPGGPDVEDYFHQRFAKYRVPGTQRELFDIEPRLRHLQGRHPCWVRRSARFTGPPAHLSELDRNERVIWALQAGPRSSSQIGAAIGIAKTTAFECLSEMRAAGAVVQVGAGRAAKWQLISQGEGGES